MWGGAHGIWAQQAIGLPVVNLGLEVGQAGDVDGAVDDDVGDVDAAGAELAGQRLGEGALGELAGGEVGEPDAAAQRGRGAGDEEGGRVGGRSVDAGQEEGEGGLGKVEEAVAVSYMLDIGIFII